MQAEMPPKNHFDAASTLILPFVRKEWLGRFESVWVCSATEWGCRDRRKSWLTSIPQFQVFLSGPVGGGGPARRRGIHAG